MRQVDEPRHLLFMALERTTLLRGAVCAVITVSKYELDEIGLRLPLNKLRREQDKEG